MACRMFRRAGVAAALLAASPLARAAGQAVKPAAFAGGEVSFAMHSTIIGAFVGRALIAHAEFAGSRLGDVRGMAEVHVSDMRTGISLRDRHMRKALSADGYPTVRFDLVEARPGATSGDSARVTLEGRLTLDGVTRPISAEGVVVMRPGGLDLEATFPLDMRDYGIKPPVRALVLRVAPDVVVTARLSFRAAPGP
jgi:polyisoprenoid-binding protein YceI